MKKGKVAAFVVAALVAGVVLGSFGIASAAPVAEENGAGYGLRLGSAMRDAGARMADILADLTGLSVEDIQDRRAEGESVAAIAESEGVDSQDVVDGAIAARTSILDAKVADGTIDEATRDEILARMTERMNERVTSDETGRMGRGNGGACGMGGGRGAGAGAGACGSCTSATQ
ncbi:MAG: hypothetical protein CVT60_07460 [Actinobacteria bacterium HGW-Actinobacteria-10]|jgi:hypothetical protein|nr:MAG: hypothetical protein CVT60_07460 [Actinobacteria bacterium HGW-Actinobacteria-10]